MSWRVSHGTDGDGSPLIVLTDNTFQNSKKRAGRGTLLAVQFPGLYMLQAAENRTAFEDHLAGFLTEYDGVFAAGVTRARSSYTFLFYLGAEAVSPGDVPIPQELKGACYVWLARDPAWTEYESYSPPRKNIVGGARAWIAGLAARFRSPTKTVALGAVAGDQDVLNELAESGSNLRTPTDLIFYLYIPTREQAEACAVALWENGYRARVSTPLGILPNGAAERRWSVVAKLNTVPDVDNLRTAADLMACLAERFGGEYDGWEAAVED